MEGSGGKRAASATLLNQAMSFAAVAGVTMWLGTKKVPEYLYKYQCLVWTKVPIKSIPGYLCRMRTNRKYEV